MALEPNNSINGRPLTSAQINDNFIDLHKPLSHQQAMAESARCLYCYDAPCIQACPTSIDIPTFIHQIRTENIKGSAKTILSQNIMGGTCARVCPTEVLCEEACVLNASLELPIEIGDLQRYAIDDLIKKSIEHPFQRAEVSGKSIAVVGAGPAGLACAHRASMLGHDVTIYEAKEKSGGLNEYGLAAYKMVDDFAQKETDFILDLGGIKIIHNQRLGDNLHLENLQNNYDAVFIGIGLDSTWSLDLENEQVEGVSDAVDFIEKIRQSDDKSQVKVGNDVIVIGAGNTAIDAAVQAKRLGAENVTLVYRRGEQQMSATEWEVNLARTNGVNIKLWSTPKRIIADEHVAQIEFTRTQLEDGKLIETPFTYTLQADMVLKAIGQKLQLEDLNGIDVERGKIVVDENYQSSIQGIYAGGDAIDCGEDLTVQAVEDGKQAAHAIDNMFDSVNNNEGEG
jgi:glutamate synthase (NADPH/NADH) small chain